VTSRPSPWVSRESTHVLKHEVKHVISATFQCLSGRVYMTCAVCMLPSFTLVSEAFVAS
jgi:hypothetical protein